MNQGNETFIVGSGGQGGGRGESDSSGRNLDASWNPSWLGGQNVSPPSFGRSPAVPVGRGRANLLLSALATTPQVTPSQLRDQPQRHHRHHNVYLDQEDDQEDSESESSDDEAVEKLR